MADIRVGDQVQARLRGEQAGVEQYLVTEFVVTGFDGAGLVLGSFVIPKGLDPVLGWEFDLIRRPFTLPEVATEIVATLSNGDQASLIGKGGVWVRSDTGRPIDPGEIQDFTTDLSEIPVSKPPVHEDHPEGQ